MKLLKRILIGLITVIVLLLITALFVKKDFRVEQEVVVNKPKSDVFNYVKLAKNQDQFNKWITSDPLIQKSYQGTDGTVGFVYAWESRGKAGKGEQRITAIREGERVDLNIHFIKPMESDAAVAFTTEEVTADQTRVKWSMNGQSPYPLNLMNLLIPTMLGSDMQASLATLKTILEK